MSWIWSQKTGGLWREGTLRATGYGGHEAGLNNPDFESFEGLGVIPRGLWYIGEPKDHPGLGPYVMALTPDPHTNTFGRSGFFIHGDSKEFPGQKLASHGCIVLPLNARRDIWDSWDHQLYVVAEYPQPLPKEESNS